MRFRGKNNSVMRIQGSNIRRRIFLFLGIVILIITGTVSAAWRPAEMLVQVKLSDIKDIHRFADQKFVIDNVDSNTLSLLVIPSKLEKIRTMGYRAVTVIPSMTRLVNSREIWIYPFVNPDGRMSMSRYNNAMVDINRDWVYMWDLESPAPFSQPELQFTRNWINENQFVISQINHGGSESIS
jgi:hypothetical protein